MSRMRWPVAMLGVACAFISLGAIASGQDQPRPNFSGTWGLVTPELLAAEKQVARAESLMARGLATQQSVSAAMTAVELNRSAEGLVIEQNATTISVTQTPAGQVVAVYKLDGTESKYTANQVPTSAKVSWPAADKLVAIETATRADGTTGQGRRSWSLGADGVLTMVWTPLNSSGGELESITAVYRRR